VTTGRQRPASFRHPERNRAGVDRGPRAGQHAAPQVFGELALDVTGQSGPFGVGCAHLGEHRLRVPRDELVQHRALGFAASVAGERLSGRAGRSFVQTACEHPLAS
jgi:hypothetical protein